MGILRCLKTVVVAIVLIFFAACHDYNREVTIGNAVIISNWNVNQLPQKAILYVYKKNDEFADRKAEYKSESVAIEEDTLNNRKLLKIVFNTGDEKLTTGFDYKLAIDNTIEYKVHELKVSPKNQGSEIYGKEGDNMISADENGIYLEAEK